MMHFVGCDGKVAQKEVKSIMFIKVPRQVYNFSTKIEETRENHGKKEYLQIVIITFPQPFHLAETLIKHSLNEQLVARSGAKGAKRQPETLTKPCRNAIFSIAWAKLQKPL